MMLASRERARPTVLAPRAVAIGGMLLAAACSSSSSTATPHDDAGTSPDDAGTSHDDAGSSHEHAGGMNNPADSAPPSDAPAGTCGALPTEYTSGNGSVTYYTFSQGSTAVNCSFAIDSVSPDVVDSISTGAGQYFGAMNTADYDNAAVCGACVEVTRDGTKTVDITIVDQCPTDTNPKCTAGHIDLSQAAFEQIGMSSEGYLGTGNGGAVGVISWKYIPCPVTTDVVFEIKPGSTQYYAPILVESHRYPIVSVDVKVSGTWTAATRQSYNYWIVAGGGLGVGPFDVRATDVNGAVVEATVNLSPGVAQTAGEQFPICK